MKVVEQFSCRKMPQFILPWWYAIKISYKTCITFQEQKQLAVWHQEQNSNQMPVENKDSRAHAFIESIFGYYLHASVYSP